MNTVTFNATGLHNLQAQLAQLQTKRVQVGLFQDTAGRVADKGRVADNPSLGAIHEFGLAFTVRKTKAAINIPERSFLRMPLTMHLGTLVLAKGASWLYLMRTRGVGRMLAFLGVLAEETIQEAFATGGWGVWPKLSRETIRRKGSSAILIETAQLRKAINSRVT